MKKPFKIIAIITGAVIGLLVIAIVVLPLIIDPNQYKDDIIRIVKKQTGRDLKIDGKLGLSIFPRLGFETGRLELSNAPGFKKQPMMQVDDARIHVELLPLLRKQVIVDAIRLNGLNLNLQKNAQGRANWDDLVRDEPKTSTEPEPKPSPETALIALSVGQIDVRRANVQWLDEQTGARYNVRNIELASGDIMGSSPADLRLSFDLDHGKLTNRAELTSQINVDLNRQTLNVPRLALSFGELKINAELTGTKILDAPQVSGRLEVARFNSRALMQQLGVDYKPSDDNALTQVAITTHIDHTTTGTTFTELNIALDDTKLTGRFALQNPAHPTYQFDLALDTIDLDRYMPAPAAQATTKENATPAPPVVVPLAPLRELTAQGKIRVQKLTSMGIKSEDVLLQITARDGRLTLGPNQAKLYGGSYAGRTVLDATGKAPRLQFEEQLRSVQLGPLLKDADVFNNFSGIGNIELKLTAQGLDAAQITRTLNGTTSVDLRDGKITGVSLQKIIQEGRAKIDQVRGKPATVTAQASDETAFQSLTANIQLTNGVARNDDLRLIGPVVRSEGQGTADLVKETLDYRLKVTLAKDAEHKGTTVPIHIGGTFAKPEFRPEIGEILKEQATKTIEKKLQEKGLDKKIDQLKDQFKLFR